jgi:hypothetical protein
MMGKTEKKRFFFKRKGRMTEGYYTVIKTVIFLCVTLFLIVLPVNTKEQESWIISSELFKNRQGPPSEFEQHRIPSPNKVTQSSDSFLMSIHLKKEADLLIWREKLPTDSETVVTVSLISTLAKDLKLKINGHNEDSITEEWIGFNEHNGIPTKTYVFKKLLPAMYEFEVSCPANTPELAKMNEEQPHLQLLVYNESPLKVQTHLTTYSLQVGEEIGVVASLYEASQDKAAVPPAGFSAKPITIADLPNPSGMNSILADMDVIMPDGEEVLIIMHDDGLRGDLKANDGQYVASLKAKQSGTYVVQVAIRAEIDMNKPGSNEKKEPLVLIRTSQHVVTVVEKSLTLTSHATLAVRANDEMVDIALLAKPQNQETVGKKFIAYAEVWGTSSSTNEFVPVAWINGMTIAEKDGENVSLKLKMSGQWLSLAKATLPLKLKNLYVLDVDTFILLTALAESNELITISPKEDVKQLLATHKLFQNPGNRITESMLMGPRPSLLMQSTRNATNGHRVLLVHGYCSNNNPFSTEDFTNYAEFLDTKQSRSNDQFAQLISKFGMQYESVSIVAHSQGGLASLHLLNFYWSHMDNAASTEKYRVIQSVGSPYRGTALAGTLASIGSIFNIGCGSNDDLTHDGAERWLATISADARKNVYYYTSQYKPWSWCNLAANAVLSWHNDGTTENSRNDLVGATLVNHVEGYCHTADMKYPPQCQNHEQNQQINSFAHP